MSSSNSNDRTSMGDLFRQRRAQAAATANNNNKKQQQPSTPARAGSIPAATTNNNSSGRQQTKVKSLTEIQAEQERESSQSRQQQQPRQQPRQQQQQQQQPRQQQQQPQKRLFTPTKMNTTPTPPSSSRAGQRGGGGGGGSSGGRGQRRGQNQQQQRRYDTYPIEQGCICSLKESFGFIYCAQRDDQVFFHYSEAGNVNNLQMDTPVQFRIGPSTRDASKMAAYQVQELSSNDEIQWDKPVFDGDRKRGLIERRYGGGSSNSSHHSAFRSNNNSITMSSEGTIRLLQEATDDDDDKKKKGEEEKGDSTKPGTTTSGSPTTTTTTSDVVVRFTQDDQQKLFGRGDLVEFDVVEELRTKQYWARNIKLLLSDRERKLQEQEQKLLATATEEHGVVTALKGEYGFLRSNSRREEVFFHYSSIDLDDGTAQKTDRTGSAGNNDDKGISSNNNKSEEVDENEEEMVLKEGQDMKFLVVQEPGGTRRVSARRVQMQPRGSVKFHHVLVRGVTGIVTQVPHCVDSTHLLVEHGRVQLTNPITRGVRKYQNGKLVDDDDDDDVVVTEVHLSPQDSPGGKYSFHGGSAVGLWVEVGDTLLFDVVQDYSDGACRAVPTSYLTPKTKDDATATTANKEEKNDSVHEQTTKDETAAIAEAAVAMGGDGDGDSDGVGNKNDDKTDHVEPAVRLIALSLVGRAEGVIGALKEMYGFIHYSERPVDVHFKLYQMLPEELQQDIRRNLGYAAVDEKGQPLQLKSGAHVSFDLSVHGTIHSGAARNHRTGSAQKRAAHERENLKAQRILVLPPKTVKEFLPLATGVKATVSKKDAMQPYVGNIELDPPIEPLSHEYRHPIVAKMIHGFLRKVEMSSDDETIAPVVFHDIMSMKEDDIVVQMVEEIGKGALSVMHIPQASEPDHPGRLCIRKAPVSKGDEADGTNLESASSPEDPPSTPPKHEEEHGDGGGEDEHEANGVETEKHAHRKKKSHKQKPFKSVRFDKQSLSEQAKKDPPPGVDDVVQCDLVQCRRTGQAHIENLVVLERIATPGVTTVSEDSPAVGIVKEVVANRNFGFISAIDETAASTETLFFTLKGDKEASKTLKLKKGDAVSFSIGTEKNGKRVAKNVALLPKGAIPSKADENACRGLVLLQPSHATKKKNSPMRKASSNLSNLSQESNKAASRWDATDEDRNSPEKESDMALGHILLTEDETGMFTSSEHPTAIKSHLLYKSGGLAIHGMGSSTEEATNPRRGDIVSFVKVRNGNGLRDIRVVSRSAATLVRGRLENLEDGGKGTVTFRSDKDEVYDVDLSELVGFDVNFLKANEAVEGILYEDSIYGIARVADLYVDTRLGKGHKQRPKLNLTVKKDRGGTIMAQSMMAKGPDGTNGFAEGWTTRVSKFSGEQKPELSPEAPEFTPGGASLSKE